MQRLRLVTLPFFFAIALLLIFFRSASRAAQPGESPTQSGFSSIPLTRIHPSLVKIKAGVDAHTPIPVIIEWNSEPLQVGIQQYLAKKGYASNSADRVVQRLQVISALQEYSLEHSAALQMALREAVLQGKATDVQAFWISPVIAAKITPDLIDQLSSREDVVQVRPDERFELGKTEFTPVQPQSGLPWNLDLIDTGLAEQLLGLDGSGVVVANLDTGVDWQHPALHEKYRGYNPHGPAQHLGNWFVVTGEPYVYPGDSNGHGTHTMGSMVGEDAENRTGVAPGARWIAVKLFDNQGYTYESWIHAAFQWIMAPNGDPALAPDIVNNSWGASNGSDDRYRPDLAALLAAGILPVFSAGNDGPDPATVGSPGSYPEALAVAAVDQDRMVAFFSSRGPGPWDETKPEVSAPGVAVRSTFTGGGYALGNGTSMAAPHVAGLAALLLQANPALTPLEIENILKATAVPLGNVIPNNDTGWGLVNAYAAALRVTSHGELRGQVTSVSSVDPVKYPSLSAVSFTDPLHPHAFSGNAHGYFLAALTPGSYDLNVSAFGYYSQSLHAISIANGSQTSLTISLPAMPVGRLTGVIRDAKTGMPLSATLTVDGTPLQAQADPLSGNYTLEIPGGTWSVQIAANAHHTAHLTQTIVAGSVYTANISLLPAPKILLVDAGRWYYESQIRYYEDALDTLDQPYTLWPIRSLGVANTPDDRPLASDLRLYDIVIWSDPLASPGAIDADGVITDFLKSGGRLLLSGEDILFLDGGGSIFYRPAEYMLEDLGLRFDHEGEVSPLKGANGTAFEGLDVFMNTQDSQPMLHPDAARISNDLLAAPALVWGGKSIGGSTANICQSYRAYWQGFGLEGAGPRSNRIELLRRILVWLETPPEPYGLVLKPENSQLIGKPGSVLKQTFKVISTGVLSDSLNLHISAGSWPLDVELPGGTHVQNLSFAQGDTVLPLKACQSVVITATVTVPGYALRDERSDYSFTFTSQADPNLQRNFALRAKVHAPLLLVDHQLWYHNLVPYTSTLQALGIPFDIYNTNARLSIQLPTTETLLAYPMILWTTGYNWYDPMGSGGESRLEAYLEQGGRLLMTSQDLLDLYGTSGFTRERLGIQNSLLSVTPTQVTGVPITPFWNDLDAWDLNYPFTNWSDAFQSVPSATIILRDQNFHAVGLIYPSQDTRTAFFSFPLETMNLPANLDLERWLLLWLSPFGNSHLQAPLSARAGSQIPITLTLGLAQSQLLPAARVLLPLPPGTSLVPGSLAGPWSFDLSTRTLVWQGALQPGTLVYLSANLELDPGLARGSSLPLQAFFYDDKGLITASYTRIWIDLPWLHVDTKVNPSRVFSGDLAHFTLTLTNSGVLSSTAFLTLTIPDGLSLLTPTLQTSSGVPVWAKDQVTWSGTLFPEAVMHLSFDAVADFAHRGTVFYLPVQASDDFNHRSTWFELQVPDRHFFPVIFNPLIYK